MDGGNNSGDPMTKEIMEIVQPSNKAAHEKVVAMEVDSTFGQNDAEDNTIVQGSLEAIYTKRVCYVSSSLAFVHKIMKKISSEIAPVVEYKL